MRTKTLAVVVAALVAMSFAAVAQEADGDATEGWIEIGAWDDDVTDSPDLVAEYEPIDGGPLIDLGLSTGGDWGSLFLSAHARDSDAQKHYLRLDLLDRSVRSETTYIGLPHRAPHDTMANLEAVTGHGRQVFHTDYDPDVTYGIDYSLLHNRTEVQLPSMSNVTFAVELRDQRRDGDTQAFTVSHCDACHVQSRNHPIDETTRDGTLEAIAAWAGGSVRARFTAREHEQDNPYVLHTYDDALHPEQRLPLFDNRLQYDADDGPIPIDFMPDIDKTTGRLDAVLADLGGFTVNGGAVWSETENQYTGLKADYIGYIANAARVFDGGWRLTWRGRAYALDSDPVFVDTIEPQGTVGPHAGLTYREVYGDQENFPELDYWRRSSLNRDVLESRADLSKRLGSRRAGTVKLSWDWEAVDRDYFMVSEDGSTETTTNILGVAWRARPLDGWRVNARWRHGEVDDPFLNVNGKCSTNTGPQVPSPFHPDADQYYDIHESRYVEGIATPESWDEVRIGASYAMGTTTTVTGLLRSYSGDNDAGDGHWSKDNHSATVTLTMAPSPLWSGYVGYAWLDSETQTSSCIPIFDG